MSSRRLGCPRCGLLMTVPSGAQAVRCSSCTAVFRLQPISNEAAGYVTGYSRPNLRAQPLVSNDYSRPVYRTVSLMRRPSIRPPVTQDANDYSPRRINRQASLIVPTNYQLAAADDGGDQRPRHRQYSNKWPAAQVVVAPPRPLASPPSAFGNKRAVVCGINYRGKSFSLKGSINDAKSMRSFLIKSLGFPADSILMLTDEEPSPQRIPTKENIRKAMRWLVQGCKSGDRLLFHYSGHGSRQKDYDGDEPDGQDEALCPLDHETEGKIIDDEINETIVWPLLPGVSLHAVIDACYSATVLDLPFVCKMNREGNYFWENHTSQFHKGTSGGLAFCLSACEDHQTSGDTTALNGKNSGAMTYGFIKALKAEPELTYGRLLTLMRLTIREAKAGVGVEGAFSEPDISEEPQLSCSEQFDVHSRKVLD